MLRAIATILFTGALVAGCSPGTDAPSPTTPQPKTGATVLSWTPCDRFECAALPVPLDYGQPAGRHIDIALKRVKATDTAHRIGSLLLNPGGPGGSGVDALVHLQGLIPVEVQSRFDLIGFDPRGVGRSAPIHCLPEPELERFYALDPVPDDDAEKAVLIEANRHFVEGCQQRSGDLLAHVGTEDAARDMDRIRAAVGDEKLTYLGLSYGTSLGAAYAELFPTRVRALVLDGAVRPDGDFLTGAREQGKGYEDAFDAFLADCLAIGPACEWMPAGGPSKEAFLALAQRIDDQPVPTGSQPLGPSEFYRAVAVNLFSRLSWPTLSRGLAEAEAGNGNLLLREANRLLVRNPNGSLSNRMEARVAISCLDRPVPKELAAYEQAASAASVTEPAFGALTAWGGLICSVWPVPPVGNAEPLNAPGTPPILVIGTANDPATPLPWAEAMASQLPQGRLLVYQGEGHTAYGRNGCTTALADAYLLTLTLPAGPLTC